MAPQLSEKEQVAQVRRVAKKRPPVSAAIVAEAASRTPQITRYMRARERKMEAVRSDSSSVATTPNTIRNPFDASTRQHDKEDVIVKNGTNALLSHTPFTPGIGIRRLPQVKNRKDIYDLPEDERSVFTTASLRQAPTARSHKPSYAKVLQSEPFASSFSYPDTPSYARREDGETLEEHSNAARKLSQIVPKEASKTQTQLPAKPTATSRVDETVTTRAEDTSPESQQEHLTELDREILHLGEDNYDFSPEPARRTIREEPHANFGKLSNEAGDEGGAHPEEPSRKRRRSSRQILNVEARNAALQQLASRRRSKAGYKFAGNKLGTQKKPSKSQNPKKLKRRLPVNELVTVTGRPGTPCEEMTSSAEAELSQDPISQQGEESDQERNQRESHEPGLRLKIKLRSRKRFGAIDISLFRMPEHREPTTTRKRPIISSYSDGFEGKEAAPIGLYMPVKYSTRRRESFQKITLKFDELTLISERPSEEHEIDPLRRPRRKRRAQKAGPTSDAHDESDPARDHRGHRNPEADRPDPDYGLLDNSMADDGENQMLLDGPVEETTGDVRVPQEHQKLRKAGFQVQITPSVPSVCAASDTPERLVSPLKRKQSAVHDNVKSVENSQNFHKSACQTPQELLGNKASVRISPVATAESVTKKTPIRAGTKSLEVLKELMMVSVQKRPATSKYDTDSSAEDGESERDSGEIYLESEEEEEEAEEEQGEASEEDNEDLIPKRNSEKGEEGNAEEESPDEELDAEVAAGCIESIPLLPNAFHTGLQVDPDWAGAPISPSVDQSQDRIGRNPSFDQHSKITGGEPTAARLGKVATQALLVLTGSELEKQSHAEPDIGSNSREEHHSDAITMHEQPPFEDSQSKQSFDLGSSWRPRIPDTRGHYMQVDEDIVDSPTPVPSQGRDNERRRLSRRHSGLRSQQLTMVRSRRHSPIPEDPPIDERGTQESVELGQKERNTRRASPHAVFESQPGDLPEIPETQFSVAPQMDYLERAKLHLSQPSAKPSLSRAKSMPLQAYFAQNDQASDKLMADGITMTAAFQHTVSPAKSPSRIPTLLEDGSSAKKSLSSLTRQASLNMGTLPGSARARTPSLHIKPPFLRSTL